MYAEISYNMDIKNVELTFSQKKTAVVSSLFIDILMIHVISIWFLRKQRHLNSRFFDTSLWAEFSNFVRKFWDLLSLTLFSQGLAWYKLSKQQKISLPSRNRVKILVRYDSICLYNIFWLEFWSNFYWFMRQNI